jgi:FtsZ-binding cell division protein ZapB
MAQFKLKSGLVIKTRHVNHNLLRTVQKGALEQFDQDNEKVPCPTYTVTLLGGAVKTYEYNRNSIKDESVTKEEKEAFVRYAQWLMERQASWQKPYYELLLYQGIDDGPDDDADWIEMCELFGITQPEGKKEKKIHWVENGLVESDAELRKLTKHLMQIPSELEAEAEKASDGFRG